MIIDGTSLAQKYLRELKNNISHTGARPHLTVITCQPSFATQKYLSLKTRKAKEVGIGINVIELATTITTEDVIAVIKRAAMQTDGIIVQLPLPVHLDRSAIIAAIPPGCDVDGMQYNGSETSFLSPVVGAIQAIAIEESIIFSGANVVVVGSGLLVGKPAALWAKAQGADVTIVTEDTKNKERVLKAADIVITGVGKPGVIEAVHLKPGVAVFDAGTAEDNGELKGDVESSAALIAALFTPVPGGIGPLTVVMLLRNVLASCEQSAMMGPR